MWFLFVCFLFTAVLIAVRFTYYYWDEAKKDPLASRWELIRLAAGDSATYFVAKFGIFGASILGMASTAGDFLGANDEVKAEVNTFISTYITNPVAVSLASIGLMILVLWARSRRKVPS